MNKISVLDMTVDDILYSIQVSGMRCIIELNLSPAIKKKYYPSITPLEQHAPVLIRFTVDRHGGKVQELVIFGSDIKAILVAFFDTYPEIVDEVFKVNGHHD